MSGRSVDNHSVDMAADSRRTNGRRLDESVRVRERRVEGGLTMSRIEMRPGLLTVVGDLDIESADTFATLGRRAVEHGDAVLIIDLSKCEFLDSTGIGSLVTVRNAAEDAGARIYLQGESQRVTRVLDIAGLRDYFPSAGPSAQP
jgi:anti-anti-sigma factor